MCPNCDTTVTACTEIAVDFLRAFRHIILEISSRFSVLFSLQRSLRALFYLIRRYSLRAAFVLSIRRLFGLFFSTGIYALRYFLDSTHLYALHRFIHSALLALSVIDSALLPVGVPSTALSGGSALLFLFSALGAPCFCLDVTILTLRVILSVQPSLRSVIFSRCSHSLRSALFPYTPCCSLRRSIRSALFSLYSTPFPLCTVLSLHGTQRSTRSALPFIFGAPYALCCSLYSAPYSPRCSFRCSFRSLLLTDCIGFSIRSAHSGVLAIRRSLRSAFFSLYSTLLTLCSLFYLLLLLVVSI
eukprot:GEMP01020342.1.p1 GENE.GEMP01020342.1~~GEMP01020342.1.p1  ORF type:complete len:301 (-),score=-8.14 GEMP01020342.1:473-1375(-)